MSFEDYEQLLELITAERLGSYFHASNNQTKDAFKLYEWNMRASAAVMELTSIVEVVVRNALDRELCKWAQAKHDEESWFNLAPLDSQGKKDIQKARDRATQWGKREERHGRVLAELSFGFWRYLLEQRYFASLWVPATHRTFGYADANIRTRQRLVKKHIERLHFVRNRAAHHEPIHRRELMRDFDAARELCAWVSPIAATWLEHRASLPEIVRLKP